MNQLEDKRHRPDWRRLYRIADWLMAALALQGLWVLGTLAGGLLLGVGPASTALAAGWQSVLREARGEQGGGPGRWRAFWGTWRREFWRGQGTVLVPALTVWPIVFWTLTTRSLPVAVVMVAIGAGLLLTLVYFPVAASIAPERSVVETWRFGVALAWVSPGPTIAIGLGVAVLAVVSVTVSSIVWPLFVPTLPVLAATWSGERRLRRRQALDLDTPV
jgi:uncharacterized membrane protein YesL